MAEETEQDTGAEASGAAVDPAAVALTLALGRASQKTADAFLNDQRGLIAIQKHHLNKHLAEQFKQLHLKVWEAQLGVLRRGRGTVVSAFTRKRNVD